MLHRTLLFVFGLFFCQISFCQTQFISHGQIEFERRINIWATLKGEFAEQLKQSTSEYKTDYFNFDFENNRSIYKPGRPSNSKVAFIGAAPANDNIVYSDFDKALSITQKNIFEKTYLIEDSLRNATWKIKDDFREIAGFNCRRATTIIMDSVFVVAFYTDEIMVTGGPESINGLPGMILGLIINRLHTTWYATKVSVTEVNPKSITPPTKGIKVDNKKLYQTIAPTFSKWGIDAALAIWSVMI
ncbi:MAG: GLPGLI family protein [Ginsengibacter sp.]